MDDHTPLQEARAYVDGNGELARALGVESSDALSVEPLGQGEHNANFVLTAADGRRFVLRVNYISQLGLSDQVGYEFSALAALTSSGRVPRALFVDSSCRRIGHGVLAESYLPGTWLDFADPAQVREAACVLADVHSVPVADDCGLLRPEDPLRDQLKTCETLFCAYAESPLCETRVARTVERFFARAEAAVAEAGRTDADATHILNTEAVPSHFLIDSTGRGSMVDWEKPVVGEAAQDVAYFLSPTTTIWDTDFIFDADGRARFIEDYWRSVDGRFSRDAFDARFSAYVMTNALIGVTWSCNALVEYHGTDRPLQNDKTRNLLPRYVSQDFLDLLWRDCFSGGR
ncbi:phosphotransferase [Eggerthellaceae bacterium zg-893]|nr:phosphotransferase [Eggerthellaceae bacterium zg-893]